MDQSPGDARSRPAVDWQRLEALFVAAVELPAAAREPFIARECGDDEALGAELRALLAAHDSAGLLDRPFTRPSPSGPRYTALPPDSIIAQRYQIHEQLGAGGMGVVYRARDLRLERTVALKFLPSDVGEDTHAKRRFFTEARAAAALEHINVCTIHEIGETETGQLYIAMAFVDGESLRDVIARGPLPVDRALDIARQIAAALGAAHERGIVHRDVKPGNIMLGAGGVAKLVDFGVAKREGSTITGAGGIPGTTAYMSPEQIRSEAVDQRTDLWALGVVLFEMLTGQRPFGGDTQAATLHAITTRAPIRLAALHPALPNAVDEVVTRALEKQPDRRFQSADEMRDALDRAAANSGPITPEHRAAAHRTHRLRIATAAVVVAVAGLAGWYTWRRVARARAIAAIPRIEALADRRQYVEAYTLAVHASRALPNDSVIRRLMPTITDRITVTSVPSGAQVWLRRVRSDGSLDTDSTLAGETPVRDRRVARGDYRVDIRKAGFAPRARIASSAYNRAEASFGIPSDVVIDVALQPAAQVPAGMVFVPGSRYALVGRQAPTRDSASVPDFAIDAFEVTNAQFREFVVAGGYTTERYWTHPFVVDGRVVPWRDAMQRLVDRTGLASPRGWSSQDFPPNEAQHPVTGVTWYEAAAYAEFVGKRLPTIFEWEKAARDGRYTHFDQIVMPWGLADPAHGTARRANFVSQGTEPVQSHPSGISPYGAYNMAGNVEEWVANPSGARRFVTGGAWDDPMYVYANFLAVSPFHASSSLGFRCAQTIGDGAANPSNVEIPPEIGPPEYHPVDDATFRALLRQYAYDRTALDSSIVASLTTPDWVRETISIAGPWPDHTQVYLYLPVRASRPVQPIVFLPGVNTFYEARLTDETERIMGPHIKAGRAVIAVLMRGMVGRPWGGDHVIAAPSTVQYRQELVMHATEVRRAIDYLETRSDIDMAHLGYVGFSKGSGSWLPIVGVEHRLRSIVLMGGGLDTKYLSALPEANSINFAPRLGAPTLLLQGRYDEENPWETFALPLWKLIPEPKRLVVVDGGHLPLAEVRVPAINQWFDETLGPVR